MKKIIAIILITLSFSCAQPEDFIVNITPIEVVDPLPDPDKCYNVIASFSRSFDCNNSLAIEVVKNSVYRSSVPPTSSQKRVICIDSSKYRLSDFYLGFLICDITVYE